MKTPFTLMLLFISAVLCAQTPSIIWSKGLASTSHYYAKSINQTLDGGYIVAGWSESNDNDATGNHGSMDYWIVKLDSTGVITWQKSFGGSDYDEATSIQQTSDSGYIVAGYSLSNDGDITFSNGGGDYWIIKLSPNGAITWQKSLGGSKFDEAASVWQTLDGGYIVAGSSESNNKNIISKDIWLVKLDPNGTIMWEKFLGGDSADIATSIQQTSDKGYIIAGMTYSNNGNVTVNKGYGDYWIVKLDSTGVITWQKSFGGSDYDEATSIQQTSDGGYIVAGYSSSTNGDIKANLGYKDGWIVKLNHTGAIIWEKSLGGKGNDIASSIQQTLDGGYIITGNKDMTVYDGSDCWIIKLNASGDILWEKIVEGSFFNGATSVLQMQEGEYILLGNSFVTDGGVAGNFGDYDSWIVKLKGY